MSSIGRIAALGLALGATLPGTADSLPGARPARAFARPTGPHTPAGTGPDLASPSAVAVEAAGTLVIIDPGRNAVLRVDPATGARQVVSDLRTGAGPAFFQPSGIAVIAGGEVAVLDNTSLVSVDPVTGDRALLSGTARGMGPPFAVPRGIAADLGSVLVADPVQSAVFRVDVTTGDRTVVSGCTEIRYPLACVGTVVGTGPALSDPVAVAVEEGRTLLVAQSGQLLRIDPRSGDRTLLADATRGSGPPIGACEGLAVEPSGSVLWADRTLLGVIRIDSATGDRVIVSDAGTGSGPAFKAVGGLAVEAAGTAVLCDSTQGSVLRIAPETGARKLLSGGPIGSGPALQCPAGVALGAEGLFVADVCIRGVLKLDTASGDHTIVSGAGRGSGPRLFGPRGVAHESSGTLLVLQTGGVLRVDPRTGNRTLLSANWRGDGQRFSGPHSIAVEPTGSALVGCNLVFCAAIFCTPEFAWEIVRVDAETGDRSLLSGGGLRGRKRGSGPSVESSGFLVVGPAGNVLAVSWEGQIVRVDPVSGDRTLVWDGSPPLSYPGGVGLESAGSLVVTSSGAVARFDPATGVSAIVSDATHGAGPFLHAGGDIAVEPDGTLIVVDRLFLSEGAVVLRVDPVSGDRTYVMR